LDGINGINKINASVILSLSKDQPPKIFEANVKLAICEAQWELILRQAQDDGF